MPKSIHDILKIPEGQGHGQYGGQFVAETLIRPLIELEKALNEIDIEAEYIQILSEFVGRPTALTYAANLTRLCGGAKIYLKREDLNHTGAHKINNAVGQILLAQKMGKKRIIAETGAGQHGVATATVAARMGIPCRIYMGKVDARRQQMNVLRMKVLGAEVVEVEKGSQTLKDAISEALRDWSSDPDESYYLIGSALGPHPYPKMVKKFQSIIGKEARAQILKMEGRPPTHAIACIGGGSNAIGLFSAFLNDSDVQLIGVEAGGLGPSTGKHAARFEGGKVGVFQGTKTYILQNEEGQVLETTSMAAGLDYSAIGPEHAHLKDLGRAQYTYATDMEALNAFRVLSRTEGILPALESAHAVAHALKLAPTLGLDSIILINLSGRGDKDLDQIVAEGLL